MTINESILEQLKLYQPARPKIRIGNQHSDGGYVIIDGYDYDCIITAGIASDVTFENDFARYRPGVPFYSFDGTVNRPANLSDNIKYYRTNISGAGTDLKDILNTHNDVFIKMDIEGYEFWWLTHMEEYLHKVKQLVFEAHILYPHLVEQKELFNGLLDYGKDGYANLVLQSLKNLASTHYLVHAHQNNWGSYVKILENEYPITMELTYIRKDCDIQGTNIDSLPIKNLDIPSASFFRQERPDRDMNFWPFKIC